MHNYINTFKNLLVITINLLIVLILIMLFLLSMGVNPFTSVWILFSSGLENVSSIGYTLFYTTNLIFTGLAVSFAYQVGLFNIGANGQATIGGLTLGICILATDHFLPGWLVTILAILSAMIGGGIWAAIPAFFKVRFHAHEVITTIMMNFISYGILSWLMNSYLQSSTAGYPVSRLFSTIHLTTFGSAIAPLNIMFVVAIVVAICAYIFLYKTKYGFDIRVLGKNSHAAQYVGIKSKQLIVIVMMIGGAFAGLMSVNTLMGFDHRLTLGYVGQLGFIGIAVSFMANHNPIGIIFSALFFGLLYQGGLTLSFINPAISKDMTTVLEGFILFSIASFTFFINRFLEKRMNIT